jgi:hypothetical protein
VLATSQVRSVSVGHAAPISTVAVPMPPIGLRSAIVKIGGLNPETEALPRFVPRDAQGDVIPQTAARRPAEPGILGVEVPSRRVDNPGRPSSGVCRISTLPLAGLKAQEGTVITRIRKYAGLVGEGFLACASTSYEWHGWSLLAGVLLSAGHPGAVPPPLPGMKSLPGHPGVVQAPGPEGEPVMARRIDSGWLVIGRAKTQQRLTLLEHLRVTLEL